MKTIFSIWRQSGLKQAPPPLSIQEKEELIEKYREQGVFNDVLSLREVHQYAHENVANGSWWLKHRPKVWRNNYKGLQNPIPIERMINPLTGKKFKHKAIRVSMRDFDQF